MSDELKQRIRNAKRFYASKAATERNRRRSSSTDDRADNLILDMRAMIGQTWTFEMQMRVERRLQIWEQDNEKLLRQLSRSAA